jgi:hemerythrin-like domain-containing protein
MKPDTHEMVVIHRFIRRELGLLPVLLRGVPAGDSSRTRMIARHGLDLLDAIRIHHSGEDELLWPLLLERSRPAAELVERMQAQHADIDASARAVREHLARWGNDADPDTAAQVASHAEKLQKVLAGHLDEEEERILPIAGQVMSAAEWALLGKHGVSHTPRNRLLRQLGQILEDTSETERRDFLSNLPPPPRILWAVVGRRQYASYIRQIRADINA